MQKRMLIPAIFIIVVGIGWIASYYTDWLWFRSLEFTGVFWKVIQARVTAGIVYGLMAAVIVGVNLGIAGQFTRKALQIGGTPWEGEVPGEGLLKTRIGYVLVGAVLVLFLGNIGAGQWPVLLRYLHSQEFGVSDPLFTRDIGYYVFVLPFYQFTANFLLGAIVVSALAVGVIYFAAGGIRVQERIEMMPRPMAHLSALGGAFMLVMALIYRLKVYGLLYSVGRIFSGAGYVDVNVQVWAYWFLVLLFLGAAGVFFMNVQSRGTRLPLIAIGMLVGGAVVVGAVPSTIVQKLVVEPNELAREEPYIQNNIDATRQAYGLDRIKEVPFEASENLTRADIEGNPLTIRNVRIWDERPLVQTYQQVQEIRPYYVFPSVDVDRYTVDGVYRQVMLSAREMATDRLPAQARNWVNERLQYTHGYGVALSPVNHVTPEGLPQLMVKDIPPISEPGLEIERPEIYYGERSYPYVAVKTGTQEFDYPHGDENKFSTYQGDGGVPMGGFFNRLAFAIRFMDVNLLLSGYIIPDSRIMFRRQIMERVRTIAPFLSYDRDPYLVISKGKLYWILDAYTTSDMYPYSTRTGRSQINYIRNSVKVVIDAFNGTVSYYQVDDKDPVIKAYAEIFPSLFEPLESMPEEFRPHLRYPIVLFQIQALQYQKYHMQDVQVFYNQEDLWEIPNEIYRDQAQPMQPYYLIVKLPGEDREEFLLLVPFTPAQKDNMIGWLAARCDGENYGDLLVYKLPKDKLIYGPMQIEARVDQQPDISSQLTLWGQRGSEVIRGNLLAVPIESSFLYIEPIYLQARQEPEAPPQGFAGGEGEEGAPAGRRQPARPEIRSTAIPELKQVIVAFGGRVIMRDTFEDALIELFGSRVDDVVADATAADQKASGGGQGTSTSLTVSALTLATEAEAHFQRVKESLQDWDWESAGKELQALERSIQSLRKKLENE